MVGSIHDVDHLMGLKTTAEFVSDDEITQKPHQIALDFAQVYTISRPLPPQDTDFAQPVIAETKQQHSLQARRPPHHFPTEVLASSASVLYYHVLA